MFMQIIVHLVILCLVSSFTQTLDLPRIYHFSIFSSFRTRVTRISSAKITQVASLDLRSRDIDACAPPAFEGELCGKGLSSLHA